MTYKMTVKTDSGKGHRKVTVENLTADQVIAYRDEYHATAKRGDVIKVNVTEQK